ncbi:MAG: hypothetical protein IPH80_01455 [Myxococcales bacterium]|nr:hypothetical protein [Myxococcales bacterium]
MQLADLIDQPATAIDAIARHLDDLDAATRWAEVGRLDRARQRTLFEKAAAAAPIDLAHFVGDAAPGVEVIHDGRNTLPLPGPLRGFQKRFCRPADGSARLFGYNEGPTRRVVGPGYFVAVPTAGRPAWQARGAIVVDYFQIPDGPVAAGWPPVVANDWRLQRLVYHHTRDFMRRVSRHVSIGAAYKEERPLDHYFVLCRQA